MSYFSRLAVRLFLAATALIFTVSPIWSLSTDAYWNLPSKVTSGESYHQILTSIVTPEGSEYIFWYDQEVSPFLTRLVFSSRKSHSHNWSPATTFSTPGYEVRSADAQVDSHGFIHVVWNEASQGTDRTVYRTIAPNNTWSTAQYISCSNLPTKVRIVSPDLIYLVCGSTSVVRMESGTPLESLSFPWIDGMRNATTVASQDGKLYAAIGTAYDDILLTSTDGISEWSEVLNISSNLTASYDPNIGVDNSGNVSIAWVDQSGPASYDLLFKSLNGGELSSLKRLATLGAHGQIFGLYVSGEGQVTVTWFTDSWPSETASFNIMWTDDNETWTTDSSILGWNASGTISSNGTTHFLVVRQSTGAGLNLVYVFHEQDSKSIAATLLSTEFTHNAAGDSIGSLSSQQDEHLLFGFITQGGSGIESMVGINPTQLRSQFAPLISN